MTNTIDPLGGSYFVESLTDRMEQLAYEYFAKIDELGGMVEAVKRGYPQREIADAAFELQRGVRLGRAQAGRRELLHGGRRRRDRDPGASTPRWSASRSTASRASAPAATPPPSKRALAELKRSAANDDHNLMPNLLDCARVHASEGEIVEALQTVFGTYTETPVF